MKLLVFGSTGGVGRQLVRQALEEGHSVTAFARDRSAVGIRHERLRTVQGDVLDLASVHAAMRGHDAVLAALGSPPFKGNAVRTDGSRHIVQAMQQAAVQRLVSLSTLGTGDTWATIPLKYKILFRTLLRRAFASHVQQEDVIAQSALRWTIVRPGAYVDGDRTGAYRHGFAAADSTIKAEISRADVADFMLRQVTDEAYVGQMPGVSY